MSIWARLGTGGSETRRGDVSSAPTVGGPADATVDHKGTLAAPAPAARRFGPYRLLREIGRGGMGTVYLAERADDQYHKQVAVKLLQAGVERDEIVRRFRRERQILASLDHAHIARLLDGGTSEDGAPYIVMEHIEGRRIDEYCDGNRLTVSQRLRLFLSVCAAVQFAHRNLVVHRDLKPGNILVTAGGEPKLLDFGIATLLETEPSAAAPTGTGLAMTPEYASPEQARGEPITTASDVYSLGVVLYELLTGQRPYSFKTRAPLEVLRAVVEQEPPRPSTAVERMRLRSAVSEDDAGPGSLDADAVGRAREGTPGRLQRRLRGDLDDIVMKALRKEPQRRYASVEAFGEDIRRHLDGLPVAARKGTLGYRAAKFVRRHRVSVAAGAVVLALLVGFAATMAVQSARLARERDRVARERDKAQKVSAFLIDLFKVVDPYQGRATVTARDVLDRGAERIDKELADQPEVRSALLDAMGTVYSNLGQHAKARALLNEALDIRRQGTPVDAGAVADTLHNLGDLLAVAGDYPAAEAALREAVARRRQVAGPDAPDVARSLNILGDVLEKKGDYPGAEAVLRDALRLRDRLGGRDHLEVAQSLNQLGLVLMARGDRAGAEDQHRQALAMRRRLLPAGHPTIAQSLNNLALVVQDRGGYDEAEALHRESLAIRRQAFGPVHPRVAMTLSNLGAVLQDKGDYARAEALEREALDVRRKVFGEEHPDVAMSLYRLGGLLHEKGDLPGALGLLNDAAAQQRKLLGPAHPRLAYTLLELAEVREDQGDPAEAEPLFRTAADVFQGVGSQHPSLGIARRGLARVLAKRGQAAEAEALARQALAIFTTAYPPGHREIADALSVLGACLAAQHRYAEAEPLLRRGHAGLAARLGESHRRTRQARQRLTALYEAWGRPLPEAASAR